MKQKFLISLVLVIILLIPRLMAQTSTPPSVGDGLIGSPYEIETLNNLYWLSQTPSEWSSHYIQTADIDASATSGWNSGAGWSPIGSSIINFNGSYDGGGHTISALFINRPTEEYQGLFGKTFTGASIKNLGMINVNISADLRVGALIGESYSNVSNCYSTGTVSGESDATGGLLGLNVTATVNNCYSHASVSNTANYQTGGLIGWNSGTVNNCYSTGLIDCSPASRVGGFIGINYSSVNDCFWNTETSGTLTGIGSGTATGAIGKTRTEMTIISTYTDAGWDFSDKWTINFLYNDGLPYLSWQYYAPIDSVPANWRYILFSFVFIAGLTLCRNIWK